MAENGSTETPQPDETFKNETTEQEQTENEEQQPGDDNAEGKPKYIRDPICDEEEMKKMFVGGITTDSTDEELKEFFEEISGGKVTDHVIIRKESDKKSHFGFITFNSSDIVDEVLLNREHLKFKDRLLDVNRAVPKNNNQPGAHEKTKKLFIANLPKTNCNEEQLMEYFNLRHAPKFGTIESIQLIKKKDEQGNKMEENKGFGFIVVSSEDFADKMAIQHASFEFGGRKIELKKSVPNPDSGRGKRGRGGGGGPQQMGYGGYSGGYAPYGGYNNWGGYDQGFGSQGYGYDYYGAAYGGGYAPQGGARGGRGAGGGRYRPY